MAVQDKTNVTTTAYTRGQFPVLEEGQRLYIQEELRRIEAALNKLNDASIQVTDEPPANPLRGMVRFNVSPWDPLGDSSEGLIVYNGTAWVAV
jgi:hypothetical protein